MNRDSIYTPLENTLDQHVVILDDDPVILKFIVHHLDAAGYRCSAYENGCQMLEAVQELHPTLFLLDMMMDDLTGIEICRQIKTHEPIKDIPVIFITSVTGTHDKLNAFDAGAVDYITKPLNVSELLARVNAHVKLYATQQALDQYVHHLEKLAQQRAEQLIHADRLATIGTISTGLAHEVTNPATFISGNIQTFKKFWDVVEPFFSQADTDDTTKQFILREMPMLICGMQDGIARIMGIVDNLKHFAARSSGKQTVCAVGDCIEHVLSFCAKLLKQIEVKKRIPAGPLYIVADQLKIEQVLTTLIVNAAQAMEHVDNPKLTVSVSSVEGRCRIIIADNGPGVAPEHRGHIFEPFFTTKPLGKGIGLGLSIARSIVNEHDGSLRLCSATGGCFELVLPIHRVREETV